VDRLKDKVAIVTGGALGIGKVTSIQLAKEGAKVAVTDIDDDAGTDTVRTIASDDDIAWYWHMDVSDEDEVQKVFEQIKDKFGKIDILVNNAGIAGYRWRIYCHLDLSKLFVRIDPCKTG
jgi:NAD(P)-dependent dehydrogenase (short-subunit alcohol dehydrogenase family)